MMKSWMVRNVLVLVILMGVVSCKSTRVKDKKLSNLPPKAVIKRNSAAAFKASSLKASMAIKYKSEREELGLTASLRMIKDSIIWINFSKLGFPVAKLLVTQEGVKFYEKLSKTSFEGDFELISDWLGTDFDFKKVQHLIVGESLLDLNKQKFQSSVVDNYYQLVPKKMDLIDLRIWFDSDHFKLMGQELAEASKEQNLLIRYKGYSEIEGDWFPKGFLIKAREKGKGTDVEVNYRNVQMNPTLRFPFRIPQGYKKIDLNEGI